MSLDYDIAGTKLITKWLHFYHYFSVSSLASRTIASGMSEDTFQLCTFRIPLLYCCPATQITNSGSRQCIYCPQYTWKWFPGLAVTFLGSRWDWLSCGFPSPPSVPFCAKGCASCCLVILALTQAPVTPVSHVWPTTVPCSAHLLSSWFCKSHSHPSQLSVYEWNSPRLFPCKAPNTLTWPVQQLEHTQLLVYCTVLL